VSWYNPGWASFVLRTLLKNEEFRDQFIQQGAYLLSTVYSEDSVAYRIDERVAQLDPEMDRHLARRDLTRAHWMGQIEVLRIFGKKRPTYFRKHIRDEFGLDSTFQLVAEVSPANSGRFRINGNLTAGDHKGLYFRGTPLSLEAIPDPFYAFDHWEQLSGGSVLLIKGDRSNYKAIMKKRPRSKYTGDVVFTEFHPTGKKKEGGDWVEITNTSGSDVDLGGWILTDPEYRYVIPKGTRLPGNASLVICNDTAAFRKAYNDKKIRLVGNIDHGYSMVWEKYYLADASGDVVDFAYFDSKSYKRKIPDNFSLELNADADTSNMSERWKIDKGDGSPGVRPELARRAKEGESLGFFDLLLLMMYLIWG
jgi:hypothetical protein